MGTLLIIDYNSLFIKAMSMSSQLSWHGKSTQGIYGFVTQFCDNVIATRPTNIIVCSDSRPYDRGKLFPSYKIKRKESDIPNEIMGFNRNKVGEFLHEIGIEVYKEPGLEADDLIAICCRLFRHHFYRIVIASGDSDLYQLFRYGNVYLRKKIAKKNVLYGYDDFKKQYNMTTKQFIRYLCILGTHNGIPGIKGMGLKAALEIAVDDLRWEILHDHHGEELRLYQKLIRLPFRDDVSEPLLMLPHRIKERDVILMLGSVGIQFNKSMDIAFSYLGRL